MEYFRARSEEQGGEIVTEKDSEAPPDDEAAVAAKVALYDRRIMNFDQRCNVAGRGDQEFNVPGKLTLRQFAEQQFMEDKSNMEERYKIMEEESKRKEESEQGAPPDEAATAASCCIYYERIMNLRREFQVESYPGSPPGITIQDDLYDTDTTPPFPSPSDVPRRRRPVHSIWSTGARPRSLQFTTTSTNQAIFEGAEDDPEDETETPVNGGGDRLDVGDNDDDEDVEDAVEDAQAVRGHDAPPNSNVEDADEDAEAIRVRDEQRQRQVGITKKALKAADALYRNGSKLFDATPNLGPRAKSAYQTATHAEISRHSTWELGIWFSKTFPNLQKLAIVDMGAGYYTVMTYLAQLLPGATLFGIEFDALRCRLAGCIFQGMQASLLNKNLGLVYGDIFNVTGVEADVFFCNDEVFCDDLLEHIFRLFDESKRATHIISAKIGRKKQKGWKRWFDDKYEFVAQFSLKKRTSTEMSLMTVYKKKGPVPTEDIPLALEPYCIQGFFCDSTRAAAISAFIGAAEKDCGGRGEREHTSILPPRDDCAADLHIKCEGECSNCEKVFHHPDCLELKASDIHGTGLFATLAVSDNQFVSVFVGRKCKKVTKRNLSIAVSIPNGMYLVPTGDHKHINHSCDPNCVLQKWEYRNSEKYSIRSIRAIASGEEITFDYGYAVDGCTCLTAACSNLIRFKTIDEFFQSDHFQPPHQPRRCLDIGVSYFCHLYDMWQDHLQVENPDVYDNSQYHVDYFKAQGTYKLYFRNDLLLSEITVPAEEYSEIDS